MNRRFLYLWFPNWPIQRLCRAEIRQHGARQNARPLLLSHRDARRGELVAACCRRSREHGVRVGMPLAEATALVQHGLTQPQKSSQRRSSSDRDVPRGSSKSLVQSLPYQPEQDRQALQRLARWCDQFSPAVGLADPILAESHSDALQLEMTGLSQRNGGERPMIERIARLLLSQGYFGHFALADTLGAARALSLGLSEMPKNESLSGIERFQSADMPICIALPGQTRTAIGSLPVTTLGLKPQVAQLLLELGIDKIYQLYDLPRSGLATRFGADLLDPLSFALDETASVIQVFHAAPTFETCWEAEHPTDRRAIVSAAIQHLCQHLSDQLLAHQQGALELECRLHYEQQELYENDGIETEGASYHQLTFQVALFQPTTEAQHLWKLLSHRFEQTDLPGMVTQVELVATSTSPRHQHQYQLWPTFSEMDTGQLADLIDRVSNRLGDDIIGAVRLRAAVLPEHAYAFIPCTGPAASKARLSAGVDRQPPAAEQRPLQLLNPPLPVQLKRNSQGQATSFCVASSANANSTRDRPISILKQHGQIQRINAWTGPERIETRWWQGQVIRRDYYQVQASGSRYWIFQSLNNQQWYLHGYF